MAAKQVDDATLIKALRSYIKVADTVVRDPSAWLGSHALDNSPHTGKGAATISAMRGKLRGEVSPAHPEWSSLSMNDRIDWWTKRISLTAAPIVAAPNLAGAISNRVPVQAALGASAAGLTVCAVAREHQIEDREQWIPLLGRILFGRDLDPATVAAVQGDADFEQPTDNSDGQAVKTSALKTLIKLTRAFNSVQSLFDERPTGKFRNRMLSKVPVVGVAGGYFGERDAMRRAAEEAAALLDSKGAVTS